MDLALLPLDAPIRTYAWGSRHTLAELQGRPSPTAEPEAELWFGAHSSAPSTVTIDGITRGLDELIAAHPRATLGLPLLERFGDQLPYLLKILAVDRPLSIQAHPDREEARRGFLEESRRQLPLDAPQRAYRDPRPKPEQVVALTSFHALVGFRPPEQMETLLSAWGMGGRPLEHVMSDLLRQGETARHATSWASRADRDADGILGEAAALFAELSEIYPDDPGLPVAMLLNRVCLAPGEALYLGPGMLHAYLRGTAVEVMGNSDNTLRCGLTPKYVSREELMTVVSFEPQLPEILRPEQRGAVGTYASPTPFFSLSVLDISGQLVALTSAGPEIFLVTEGQCTLHAGGEEVSLTPGRACFVPAITEALEVTGEARVFRASSSD